MASMFVETRVTVTSSTFNGAELAYGVRSLRRLLLPRWGRATSTPSAFQNRLDVDNRRAVDCLERADQQPAVLDGSNYDGMEPERVRAIR